MKSKKYIGYYTHHQGSGHITKALEVLPHIKSPVKLFSSKKLTTSLPHKDTYIELPGDVDINSRKRSTPSYLHFSSTRSNAIHNRMNVLAGELDNVRLLMVDVSVEVTALARLLSIPTVVMRMHGQRTDMPHMLAYESAEALLAPFPKKLEQDNTPEWVKDKTIYLGGFSKFQARHSLTTLEARKDIGIQQDKIVTVVTSLGGEGIKLQHVCKLAKESPEWQWLVVGKTNELQNELPTNIHLYGTVEDTWVYLCAADIVVGSAGHNTVMEIAAADKPAIIIPEPRPFREQEEKADALQKNGLATVFSTTHELLHEDITKLLERVSSTKTAWSTVVSSTALQDFAKTLDELYNKLVW